MLRRLVDSLTHLVAHDPVRVVQQRVVPPPGDPRRGRPPEGLAPEAQGGADAVGAKLEADLGADGTGGTGGTGGVVDARLLGRNCGKWRKKKNGELRVVLQFFGGERENKVGLSTGWT